MRAATGPGLIVALALLSGCGPMTVVVGGHPADQQLQTKVVHSDDGLFLDRIAMIDISGMIVNANKPALLREGVNPVSELAERLDAAARDARVKALLLRIHSPGGTVTASDAMYREVLRWKQKTGQPVVALLMDVGASGAYYVACSADRIVAYPTTITASIGVIVQTVSVKPALGRLGIETEALTTGPNKEAGSMLARMTDEHRAVLRRLVDNFYARFTAVVRQARPNIPADQFARVTDGRVVSGDDALPLGLVDQIGDLHTAIDEAKRLAGLERARVIVYHRPLDYVGSAYAATPAGSSAQGTQVNLAQFNFAADLPLSTAGFYYLWSPTPP